jgi:alanyl-tRNA synthetase
MTLRLYYDSDALEFDATVVAHDGDQLRVILDRTAFYPTSGGQPHDTGTINGVRVIDVIDGGDHVVHVLEGPLPPGPARGAIDATRRRDFTVQHTAQHLISAIAADKLGWNTASVHFSDTRSTIEFDTDAVSDSQLESLATACNDAIAAAVPVTIDYADAATTSGLRKPSDRDGLIRIVTIEGIDRSACGGTHVNNTAGIGAVYLADIEKIRGRVRVGYLAGPRITGTLRDKSRTLAELARLTAIAEPELIDVLPRRMEQLRQAEKRIATLEAELAANRVDEMLARVDATAGGIRRVAIEASHGEIAFRRRMVEAIGARRRALAVAIDPDSQSVMLGVSADSGLDAGTMLRGVIQPLGGRGGGSATFAQGTVPDATLLNQVGEQLLSA